MNCCDEYCSNHGCNQGRDCPVRMQRAKVAKIGRRDYGKEALPATAWRAYLRHLAKWMLIVLAIMCLVPVLVTAALAQQPPASKCAELVKQWTVVPAYLRIKCKVDA